MLERINLASEDHGVLYSSEGSISLDYNALCASLSNRYIMPCVRESRTGTKKTFCGIKMQRSIHCAFVQSMARSNGRIADLSPVRAQAVCEEAGARSRARDASSCQSCHRGRTWSTSLAIFP
jgi:hypothetical protein